MTFKVPVAKVDSITTHPTQPHNSVVQAGGYSIVTMKNEDGSLRFAEGEYVLVVPENAVVPDNLLQATGFWNTDKNKGGLAGSKGNRVKGRVVDGVPSEALIWRLSDIGASMENGVARLTRADGFTALLPDRDTSEFYGITEYIPQ